MTGRRIELRIGDLVLDGVDGDAQSLGRALERELGERLGRRSWEQLGSRSLALLEGEATLRAGGDPGGAIAAGIAGALEGELIR